MKFRLLPLSDRIVLGFVVGCMLTFPLSVWITRKLDAPKGMTAALAQDGFNYNSSREPAHGYEFPGYGEKIDLANLKERTVTGSEPTLAEKLGGRTAILVAIDPTCSFCFLAADQMKFVHDQTAKTNIPYYLVALRPIENAAATKYREKVGSDIPLFTWSNDQPLPRKSLSQMPTPTHMLVNGEGTILRIWPGSSSEGTARSRMGIQIVADTLAIMDALEALKRAEKKN